jgi:hypothetical protein
VRGSYPSERGWNPNNYDWRNVQRTDENMFPQFHYCTWYNCSHLIAYFFLLSKFLVLNLSLMKSQNIFYILYIWIIKGGVWDCFSPRFLAERFQLHALCSRKKGRVVRARSTNSNFLWSCSMVKFIEQSQTPPKCLQLFWITCYSQYLSLPAALSLSKGISFSGLRDANYRLDIVRFQ